MIWFDLDQKWFGFDLIICDLIFDLRFRFKSFLQMICDLYLWFDLWFAHHCKLVKVSSFIQDAVKVTRRCSYQQKKWVFSAKRKCQLERSGCLNSARKLFHSLSTEAAKTRSTRRVRRCSTHVWTLEYRSSRQLVALESRQSSNIQDFKHQDCHLLLDALPTGSLWSCHMTGVI